MARRTVQYGVLRRGKMISCERFDSKILLCFYDVNRKFYYKADEADIYNQVDETLNLAGWGRASQPREGTPQPWVLPRNIARCS